MNLLFNVNLIINCFLNFNNRKILQKKTVIIKMTVVVGTIGLGPMTARI